VKRNGQRFSPILSINTARAFVNNYQRTTAEVWYARKDNFDMIYLKNLKNRHGRITMRKKRSQRSNQKECGESWPELEPDQLK
jgi:hypothetical protein